LYGGNGHDGFKQHQQGQQQQASSGPNIEEVD
jgi:hypothetical protein